MIKINCKEYNFGGGILLGAELKVLKFNKVNMRTHRRSGLLISKIAL